MCRVAPPPNNVQSRFFTGQLTPPPHSPQQQFRRHPRPRLPLASPLPPPPRPALTSSQLHQSVCKPQPSASQQAAGHRPAPGAVRMLRPSAGTPALKLRTAPLQQWHSRPASAPFPPCLLRRNELIELRALGQQDLHLGFLPLPAQQQEQGQVIRQRKTRDGCGSRWGEEHSGPRGRPHEQQLRSCEPLQIMNWVQGSALLCGPDPICLPHSFAERSARQTPS